MNKMIVLSCVKDDCYSNNAKHFLEKHEPYPVSLLDGMMFDDKRFDEERLKATMALICLLRAGFSENEVNPWKKKE